MAQQTLTGLDIICLSSIDWDFLWQGHQEIMATFARSGNRVLFVENTGVRPPTWRDLPRLRARIRNWRRGVKGFRQERPNLFVFSPLLLPFPYSTVACWINRALVLRALRRWMRAAEVARPMVWTFLPTPLARDLMRGLNPQLTVYYCIDDFASSSPHARKIRRSETRLFQEADLVFVTSEALRRRAAQCNAHVHLFPFGVRFEQFEAARTGADSVPPELQALHRPVVGYIGGLHQWVDQTLLAEAARRLPQANFVLVGPLQTDTSQLAQCPNIHLLGRRAHQDLPRYIKGFDVGIIPYRLSRYTAHVYPTKLNEYLAMGIPVVSTDLPEVNRFNAEHGALIGVARDPEEFARTLSKAWEERHHHVEARIAAARANSWESRMARMGAVIQEQLVLRHNVPAPWEARLRRLYHATRRRVTWPLAVAMGLYGLVFHTPLVWWAAEPLRLAHAPQPADAIVVFAGGAGESGQPGQGYEERVAWAVELYRRGLAGRLLFSSGYTYTFREPEVMRALAVSLGVPADRILLDTQSSNTMENVRNAHAILTQHGWSSALLVSSPYHMRRAALVWRRMAPGTHVLYAPIPASRYYGDEEARRGWKCWGRHVSLRQIRGILHEYLGLVYYWWRGWI